MNKCYTERYVEGFKLEFVNVTLKKHDFLKLTFFFMCDEEMMTLRGEEVRVNGIDEDECFAGGTINEWRMMEGRWL